VSVYADSSFLFSYYSSDANSTRADAWRQLHPDPLPLSAVHCLELHNAFELAVFQNRISSTQAKDLWHQIEHDLTATLLTDVTIILSELFDRAESLAELHTAQTGARSLDILHVASAQMLAAEEIVTFDIRQAALSARVGLRVAVL